jgi:hypothetical protein
MYTKVTSTAGQAFGKQFIGVQQISLFKICHYTALKVDTYPLKNLFYICIQNQKGRGFSSEMHEKADV